MFVVYACDYCKKPISDNKTESQLHEDECRKQHELYNHRLLNKDKFLSLYYASFDIENPLPAINAYLMEMYDDCFTTFNVVSFTFREFVSTDSNARKYNSINPSRAKPGFTGQLHGKVSKRGMTPANYPELGFILDTLNISNGKKGWNSGFRIFAEGFDNFAHYTAKYYLRSKV